MSTTWMGKESEWPDKVHCFEPDCEDECDLVDDEGGGYVTYFCPTHGQWGCQYDDSDEDMYDPDLDFGDYDPFDDEDGWDNDDQYLY